MRFEGTGAFVCVTLPGAKMLLKQAAGRLIRSRTDRAGSLFRRAACLAALDWNIPAALPQVKYRRLVVSSNLAAKSVAPAGPV